MSQLCYYAFSIQFVTSGRHNEHVTRNLISLVWETDSTKQLLVKVKYRLPTMLLA